MVPMEMLTPLLILVPMLSMSSEETIPIYILLNGKFSESLMQVFLTYLGCIMAVVTPRPCLLVVVNPPLLVIATCPRNGCIMKHDRPKSSSPRK